MSCPKCRCRECASGRRVVKERAAASAKSERERIDRERMRMAMAMSMLADSNLTPQLCAHAFRVADYHGYKSLRELEMRAGLREGRPVSTLRPFERRLYASRAVPVSNGDHFMNVEMPPDNWPIGTTKRRPAP